MARPHSTVNVDHDRHEMARALIREGVERALGGTPRHAPLAESWDVELEFANPVEAYRGSFFPGVDYPEARRLRFQRDDWFEVLRVLRFLASQPDPVPLERICAEVGLPRSTAYHLLRAMIEEGFVTHVADDHTDPADDVLAQHMRALWLA